MKIEQIRMPDRLELDNLDNSSPAKTGVSFLDTLKESIEKVNDLQEQADVASSDLVSGSNTDIVQTMVTMEKADISFRLMMQVRNKIIQAYEEIMRMQT